MMMMMMMMLMLNVADPHCTSGQTMGWNRKLTVNLRWLSNSCRTDSIDFNWTANESIPPLLRGHSLCKADGALKWTPVNGIPYISSLLACETWAIPLFINPSSGKGYLWFYVQVVRDNLFSWSVHNNNIVAWNTLWTGHHGHGSHGQATLWHVVHVDVDPAIFQRGLFAREKPLRKERSGANCHHSQISIAMFDNRRVLLTWFFPYSSSFMVG